MAKNALMKRIELRTLPSGRRQMRVLKTGVALRSGNAQQDKVMKAADVAIFPINKSIAMPKVSKQLSGVK